MWLKHTPPSTASATQMAWRDKHTSKYSLPSGAVLSTLLNRAEYMIVNEAKYYKIDNKIDIWLQAQYLWCRQNNKMTWTLTLTQVQIALRLCSVDWLHFSQNSSTLHSPKYIQTSVFLTSWVVTVIECSEKKIFRKLILWIYPLATFLLLH